MVMSVVIVMEVVVVMVMSVVIVMEVVVVIAFRGMGSQKKKILCKTRA